MKTAEQKIEAERLRIQKSNIAFRRLSRPQQRVEIARDALSLMRRKKLSARRGAWAAGINGPVLPGDYHSAGEYETYDAQEKLLKSPECNVCALGALFVCGVRKADKLKVSARYGMGVHEDDVFDYLGSFFSQSQLKMMECTFENGGGAVSMSELSPAAARACRAFGKKYLKDYDNGDRLLRAILRNVINNGGTFAPARADLAANKGRA
jgi:hypothetical protein